MTLPQHGSPEWHEERREYLGASEVAGALDLSPYEKPLDVWARKLGIVPPREPSFAMEAGNALEPVILARYQKRTGAIVRAPGSIVHLLEPWLRATPDAIADERRNVQVKWVPHARDKWGDESEGPEGVPEWYLIQVQIEMEVIGIAETDIAAQIAGEEMPRIYRVPRDAELAGALVDEARAWWATYILPRSPDIFPDGAGSRDVLAARFPKIVRDLQPATPEIERLAREYDAARATEREAKAAKDATGDALCALIRDAEGFEGSFGRVVWRARKGYTVAAFDVEAGRALDVRMKGERT